jgi:hypothetical protein
MESEGLDPGIKATVHLLRAHGFKTTDSGDGVSKPADERVFDCPHVAATVKPKDIVAEARRMQGVLGDEWRVEASYSPGDGVAVLLATKVKP